MRLTAVETGKDYAFVRWGGRDSQRFRATATTIGDKTVTITYDRLQFDKKADPGAVEIIEAEVRPDSLVCPWGETGIDSRKLASEINRERRKRATEMADAAVIGKAFRLDLSEDDIERWSGRTTISIPFDAALRVARRLNQKETSR